MLRVAVLFAFAVVGAVAQGPSISDDFSAQVELVERIGEHRFEFHGEIDESYTNKKSKVDASTHSGTVTFLRLFSEEKEYEIHDNRTCHAKHFNETMFPAFSWAKEAQKSHTACYSNGRTGSTGVLYTHDGHYKEHKIEGFICVDATNEKIPFWTDLAVHNPGRDEFNRLLVFHSFTPSNPSPSVFVVPSICPATK